MYGLGRADQPQNGRSCTCAGLRFLTGAGGVLGRDAAGGNVLVLGRGGDPAEDDVLGEAITGLESRHFCL